MSKMIYLVPILNLMAKIMNLRLYFYFYPFQIFQKIYLNLHPSKALSEKEIFEKLLSHERDNNTPVFEMPLGMFKPNRWTVFDHSKQDFGKSFYEYIGNCVFKLRKPTLLVYSGSTFTTAPNVKELLCFPTKDSRFFVLRTSNSKDNSECSYIVAGEKQKDGEKASLEDTFVNKHFNAYKEDYPKLFQQLNGSQENKFVRSAVPVGDRGYCECVEKGSSTSTTG
eukprot:GHVP01001280.1.p1 GENE.GHVP01001280.1~~GHVP01001280.1.p1  ORF type:complete len:224 (+),score=28.15 GHVP01001280.1:449-1120(+)